MGIFRDRSNKTIAELEDYYTNRQGSGMAWVMAFLSLLVTVAVLAGLFFGGRWIYRTLTDNNETSTTVTTSVGQAPLSITTDSDDQIASSGEASKTESGNDSEQESAILGGSVSAGGVVTDEAASTDTPSSDAREAQSDTITSTGGLPDTGAGEILIIAPVLALTVGYYISRKNQLS